MLKMIYFLKARVGLASIVLIMWSPTIRAQSNHSEVRAVIDRLFAGMRAGDSAMVSRSVLPTATLQTIMAEPNGDPKIEGGSIAGFLTAVGTPHKDTWDERIYDVVVQVDGPMATVWAPYKFYRGSAFSHCGVNAFSLLETANGWKISGITDTRRKENCL